jgi:peptide/nickel transport system permease protein
VMLDAAPSQPLVGTSTQRPSSLWKRFWRSPASRLVGRRAIHAVPVIIGASFVTFAAINLDTSTTIHDLLGLNYTRAGYLKLYYQLHFNQPFFTRYIDWLGGFFIGHWGTSYLSGVPVTTVFSQHFSVTLELTVFAFILTLVLAIPLSVLAATRPRSALDRSILFLTMLGLATPQFVLGLLLILVFAVHFKVLPSIGAIPLSQGIFPSLRSYLLPAITLSFGLFCGYIRVLRADIIDQIDGEDYIVTARAKGLSHWVIVYRHALRNALFGLITLVAVNFSGLIGGAVIVEQVFTLPGMGQELLSSIVGHDVPVALAFDTVIAISVVVFSLLGDLLYAVLDPRIRHERADR